MTEDARRLDSLGQLRRVLARGDVSDGHRSRSRAAALLPGVALELKLPPDQETAFQAELTDFVTEVILGASWYSRMLRRARRNAAMYVFVNAAILVLLPIGIAAFGDTPVLRGLVPQASSILTGVLALQKTGSAWYAQQQNYASWYKASSDLKTIYYRVLQRWAGQVLLDPEGFRHRLIEAQFEAREIMEAERVAFYMRLALPRFDILGMLTSINPDVARLFRQIAPARKNEDQA